MPKRLSSSVIQEIHNHRDAGLSKRAVARLINIDYSTCRVYWTYAPLAQSVEAKDFCRASFLEDARQNPSSVGSNLTGGTEVLKAYVFLLGCYFGDGYINKQGKYTYKIRFAMDTKYPTIISEVLDSLRLVYDSGFVTPVTDANCVSVAAHSNMLPFHFPHLGVGAKHLRSMVLQQWQQQLVIAFPWEFIRGLYLTDGSRYVHRQNGYKYVKYNFTNRSKDITDMFCWACDIAGVGYTVCSRPGGGLSNAVDRLWTVTIGRKPEVAKCEDYLGPKT